ncbi:DUF6417 family protein [Streptomyces sp. NPDC096311]|uniref:DUF6417 family protein n=1 Tax=Streptomyces sp. NPDC096311 TaxID=3366083 RepID=UPI0038209AA9
MGYEPSELPSCSTPRRIPPPYANYPGPETMIAVDPSAYRGRLYLTQEQMGSVAYGLWLHRMTGSAAEVNRFGRAVPRCRAASFDSRSRTAPHLLASG